MSFNVSADAYGRFMGRYSEPLGELFADFALLEQGQRALDVGCGPGALTAPLVQRLGPDAVVAVDPSVSFVEAAQERFPGVDVRAAVAEQLPFDDDSFDASLAQLVVHFMSDPAAGMREMARVTRSRGLVAACVWDHGGGVGPLSPFWRAVHDLHPRAEDESGLVGSRGGQLEELCATAGLRDIESTVLTVHVRYDTFDEWWEPYTFGVGPAGTYVAGLDDDDRERLRVRCEEMLSPVPFEVTASAWSVRARV